MMPCCPCQRCCFSRDNPMQTSAQCTTLAGFDARNMTLPYTKRLSYRGLVARGAADFVDLFGAEPCVPVALAKRMASLRDRIQNIVFTGAKKKVLRVGTASVVARMAHTLIAGAYAVMQRVAEAVRKNFLLGDGANDHAIAIRGCALPAPAAARFHDAQPELFFRRELRASLVLLQYSTPTRLVVVVSAQTPCKHRFNT